MLKYMRKRVARRMSNALLPSAAARTNIVDVITLDRGVRYYGQPYNQYLPIPAKHGGAPGSMQFQISRDALNRQVVMNRSEDAVQGKHDAVLNDAVNIATAFNTNIRVIDVLGDQSCGWHVKSLLTGRHAIDGSFGTVGKIRSMAEDSDLLDSTYDLVILAIEGDKITAHVGIYNFSGGTQTFNNLKKKAIVVHRSNHWYIVAPFTDDMEKNIETGYVGKDILWRPTDFHGMMGRANSTVTFTPPPTGTWLEDNAAWLEDNVSRDKAEQYLLQSYYATMGTFA